MITIDIPKLYTNILNYFDIVKVIEQNISYKCLLYLPNNVITENNFNESLIKYLNNNRFNIKYVLHSKINDIENIIHIKLIPIVHSA